MWRKIAHGLTAIALCVALFSARTLAELYSAPRALEAASDTSSTPDRDAAATASLAEAWLSATVVLCDEWVSLRAQPSTQAERLAKIPLGAEVEMQLSNGEFCLCRYQGQTGYVLAQYLLPMQGNGLAAVAEAYVLPNVNEFLTLRSASGATIAAILPGERLRVLGWRKAECIVERVSTGQTGYVHSGYIRAEDMDPDDWPYDHDALNRDIEALRGHEHIAVESIATTADGRNVYMIRCGDEEAGCHILIQCGMHARELMTSRAGGDLLRAFVDAHPTGIDGVCVHIAPLVNPDGQAVALYGPSALRDPALAQDVRRWVGDGIWRNWKANARGVDLNRNFDAGWNALTGREPGSMGYRGPSPHSEAESQALADYVGRYPFDCTVSIHSCGSVIYWAGATGALELRTRSMANVISATTGYELAAGESNLEKGGFKDWALEKAGIPSVTVEIGAIDSAGSPEECSAVTLRLRGLIENLAAWALGSG